MVKIGVLGAGHLGRIHIKLNQQIEGVELVGFFDPDDEKAAAVSAEFGVKRFNSMQLLVDAVDAVDIVTPTLSHFNCAVSAIRKGKHVFIEKPMTGTLGEAANLVDLVSEADVIAQIGHVERFNPAFLAIKDIDIEPMFIEAHRLAMFNPRGTDVSVILDLMIHDIDLILSLVKANVKKVSASGVPVISNSMDIANARIEFDNGCVANITSSRISVKNMRKMRLFQRDAYISVDFMEKKTKVFHISPDDPQDLLSSIPIDTGNDGEKKYIRFEQPEIPEVNSIQMELELFRDSILTGEEPAVSVIDGYNAMKVAYQVLDRIGKNGFGC